MAVYTPYSDVLPEMSPVVMPGARSQLGPVKPLDASAVSGYGVEPTFNARIKDPHEVFRRADQARVMSQCVPSLGMSLELVFENICPVPKMDCRGTKSVHLE